MPFIWGLLMSLLTGLMHWVAVKCHYESSEADIAGTATMILTLAIALVCGAIQHFFPKGWAYLKSKWPGGGASFGIVLIVGMLLVLPGCPPLPANPTTTQIAAAQDNITKIELGYIVFTTALDAEINKPTFDAKKRALIQATEQLFWNELEKAYTAAGNGQNVDAHQLTIDLATFKTQVVAIQNGAPSTQP